MRSSSRRVVVSPDTTALNNSRSVARLGALSDEALAKRVQTGDDEAWRVLYARSYEYLLEFAVSLGRSGDVADDLAQETLLRAWQYRKRYNPAYPYRGWLRTIMRRVSTTLHRRDQAFANAVTKARGLGLDAGWHADVPEDAFTYVDRIETRERLQVVLDMLKEDDRAILLAWSEGAGGKELAEACEILQSTARGRLMRAKERFAEAYARVYESAPRG